MRRYKAVVFSLLMLSSVQCAAKSKRANVATAAVPNVVAPSTSEQDSANSIQGTPVAGGVITVTMVARNGSAAKGSMQLNAFGDHLQLAGTMSGLTPRAKHALHIQVAGSCASADAASAGDDFIPDLPASDRSPFNASIGTITADDAGNADVKLGIFGYSLSLGQPASILSRSLVIYEKDGSIAAGLGQRWSCGRIDAGSEPTPAKPTLYHVVFTGNSPASAGSGASGAVDLRQVEDGVALSGVLNGLAPNTAFSLELRTNADHVACSGDFAAVGPLWAPFATPAADPSAPAIALGDLGTLTSDASGKIVMNLTRDAATLTGVAGIVGRAITLRTAVTPGSAFVACGVIN